MRPQLIHLTKRFCVDPERIVALQVMPLKSEFTVRVYLSGSEDFLYFYGDEAKEAYEVLVGSQSEVETTAQENPDLQQWLSRVTKANAENVAQAFNNLGLAAELVRSQMEVALLRQKVFRLEEALRNHGKD